MHGHILFIPEPIDGSLIRFSVPPKIDYVAPSTRVDVSKGASIKLECRATGNPPPKIVWSRKVTNGRSPTQKKKTITNNNNFNIQKCEIKIFERIFAAIACDRSIDYFPKICSTYEVE